MRRLDAAMVAMVLVVGLAWPPGAPAATDTAPGQQAAESGLASLDLSVSWHRIGAGGGRGTSAGFELHGTIGQHEVSLPGPVGTGSVDLRAGFWILVSGSSPAVIDLIFRDRYQLP